MRSPSPIQSHPVYILRNLESPATSILGLLILTHMIDWEEIDLIPFERSHNRTTIHMSHFIKKIMINTLFTMKILQQQGHASTNLFPKCGTVPETIHYLYRLTNERSSGRWTASVDALGKWIETWNMDPDISTQFQCTPIHHRKHK